MIALGNYNKSIKPLNSPRIIFKNWKIDPSRIIRPQLLRYPTR